MNVTKRRSLAIVFNEGAGSSGRERADDLVRLFSRELEVRLHTISSGRSAEDCTRVALAEGAEVVLAVGGDGTVSGVAGALVGGDATLAVLPRGTANSFATALGLPFDPEDVCDLLRSGSVQQIDAASCRDRTMILHATVGAHADVIGGTPRNAKNRWGALAYAASALEKLVALEPFAVRIEADEHVIVCSAVVVTVANLAPVRTLVAQGPASVRGDDALLDVTIVAATGLVDAVAAGAHLLQTALAGEPAARDDIGYFACRRVRIEADPPQRVIVDGEAVGPTPVAVELHPRSLRVAAPQAEEAGAPRPRAKLAGLPDVNVTRRRSQ